MTDKQADLDEWRAAQIAQAVREHRRRRCEDCGKNWADPPSKLCPGCEAYREHTGAI